MSDWQVCMVSFTGLLSAAGRRPAEGVAEQRGAVRLGCEGQRHCPRHRPGPAVSALKGHHPQVRPCGPASRPYSHGMQHHAVDCLHIYMRICCVLIWAHCHYGAYDHQRVLDSATGVYRDLKTSNILLTGDGAAKVSDVGLSTVMTAAEPGAWDRTAGVHPLQSSRTRHGRAHDAARCACCQCRNRSVLAAQGPSTTRHLSCCWVCVV